MTGYSGPERRRTNPFGIPLQASLDEIRAHAAEVALDQAAARVRAWGAGLTTEEQRWVAAAAADVVEGGSR